MSVFLWIALFIGFLCLYAVFDAIFTIIMITIMTTWIINSYEIKEKKEPEIRWAIETQEDSRRI